MATTQPKRHVQSRGMPGYTGRESCQRLVNEAPNSERCQGRITRHYGEAVVYDGVNGFTGWRGPFCSTRCYLEAYPES